jgi:ribosomal protein L29
MSESFKTMSGDELARKVGDLRSEGLKLRIQKKTGQLVNTATITRNRKDIARCLFELNKKK